MDSWRSMSEWKLQIIHRRSYHTVWNQFKLLFKLFWEFVTWEFSHEHFRSPFVGKGHKCDTPSLICPWNSIKINIATISNCIPSNCLGKVKRNPRINQVDTYNLIFQKKIHVYMCENFNCAFQFLPSERLIRIFFFLVVRFILCFIWLLCFLFCLLKQCDQDPFGPSGLENPMADWGIWWWSSFNFFWQTFFQRERRTLSKSDLSPGCVQIMSQAVFRLWFQALVFTNLVLAEERSS